MKEIAIFNRKNKEWEMVNPTEIDIIGKLVYQELMFKIHPDTTPEEAKEFMDYLNDEIQGMDDCDYYNTGIDVEAFEPYNTYLFFGRICDLLSTHTNNAMRELKYLIKQECLVEENPFVSE